jgi:predicted amidophosphoribosyltransferase
MDKRAFFCPQCLEQITFIERQERCRICFAELHKGRCERCIHRSVIVHRQIATCEPLGPAGTLATALKSGQRECIPAAASLMAYHWIKESLPLPDALVPLPLTFWQKQRLGFDVHALLAEEIGKIFSLPVYPVLKRRWDWERLRQGEIGNCIQHAKKNKISLSDQRLLIISPTLDDADLREGGKTLRTFFPAQVEALTFSVF